MRVAWVAVALVASVTAAATSGAVASAFAGTRVLMPIAADPLANPQSSHRTIVEPDSFSFGDTIVIVHQVGRFKPASGGGAAAIGYATSTNGGATWTSGLLPSITPYTTAAPGPWARASDPSIAYDPARRVWLAQTLAIDGSGSPHAVLVSRSADGLSWGAPVTVATDPARTFDKNWIACDTWAASPFRGRCYSAWDVPSAGGRLELSTSADGGATWGTPLRTADSAAGIGVQPVVRPSGQVVVPYLDDGGPGTIRAFTSTNGGASWSATTAISAATTHAPADSLRAAIPLPSAEVDGGGRVYVVWQDCRFRPACSANDVLLATSTAGATFGAPVRVPLGGASAPDHVVPGIGADRATAGSTAHVGLAYYDVVPAGCTSGCSVAVGWVRSSDGAATWTRRRRIAGPMPTAWLAPSNLGPMFGDYISVSANSAGAFFPAVIVARQPGGGLFDQGLFTGAL